MKSKIRLFNKIAAVGLKQLDEEKYEVGAEVDNPDAILVRSASLHELAMNENLLAIARCGAGVNNIPVGSCSEKGIVVFNTPGANANGVKELTIAALLLASRGIIDGIAWAKSLDGTTGVASAVEAGKSKFAGCELAGKTLGVIGLGAIGGMVANAAVHLGMSVIGCDPYLTVEGAWSLSRTIQKAVSYEDIYKEADYITLHVPATPSTRNMINHETLQQMKDGAKLINLSRADLVDAQAVKEALASGKLSCYVTDFPTDEIVGVPGAITIPHLGASTEESEDNCAQMAVLQLMDYLETGNIRNSVNYPDVSIPYSGAARISVFHENIPSILSQISGTFSASGINIENMINKSKGNNAYTLVEVAHSLPENLCEILGAVQGIQRVRVIDAAR